MAANKRFKTKIQADAGFMLPSGAGNGKPLLSDASGNGAWGTAATLNVYEQPGDPGIVATGSVWIDTDADLPVAVRPYTYRDLRGAG